MGKSRLYLWGLALAVALGGIVGCARHPSQEELGRLKEVRQAAALAEKELESKQKEKASLEAQISQKRAELKELEAKRDAVKMKLEGR
ncbi:MAG: hypothetical protein DRP95_05675 [Candidatus Latescibacterota bacterium]|nr:MAG: hypothetical protein DRP95_05675 [Candidatus Latescibacterota bacterium]